MKTPYAPYGQAMATRLCGTGLESALLCRQHTLHGVSGHTQQSPCSSRRNGLPTPFADSAHRVGAPQDPGFFGVLDHGISGRLSFFIKNATALTKLQVLTATSLIIKNATERIHSATGLILSIFNATELNPKLLLSLQNPEI